MGMTVTVNKVVVGRFVFMGLFSKSKVQSRIKLEHYEEFVNVKNRVNSIFT